MASYIYGLILFTIIGLVVFKIVKDKKSKKSACGCSSGGGCTGCGNH